MEQPDYKQLYEEQLEKMEQLKVDIKENLQDAVQWGQKDRPDIMRVTSSTVSYEYDVWESNGYPKKVYDKLHERYPDDYPKREEGDNYNYISYLYPLNYSGIHEKHINIDDAFMMCNHVYEMFNDDPSPKPLGHSVAVGFSEDDLGLYISSLQGFLEWLEYDGSTPEDDDDLNKNFPDTIVDPMGYVQTAKDDGLFVNPQLKELRNADDYYMNGNEEKFMKLYDKCETDGTLFAKRSGMVKVTTLTVAQCNNVLKFRKEKGVYKLRNKAGKQERLLKNGQYVTGEELVKAEKASLEAQIERKEKQMDVIKKRIDGSDLQSMMVADRQEELYLKRPTK